MTKYPCEICNGLFRSLEEMATHSCDFQLKITKFIKNIFLTYDPVFLFDTPERFVIPYGEVIEYKSQHIAESGMNPNDILPLSANTAPQDEHSEHQIDTQSLPSCRFDERLDIWIHSSKGVPILGPDKIYRCTLCDQYMLLEQVRRHLD